MRDALLLLAGTVFRLFHPRRKLLLENLALRQQLATLKRRRPRLGVFDKAFWVLARCFWSGWKEALIVVSPETVVRWHRAGFALYWRILSRARRMVGRKRISKEVSDLIFRMVAENPTWGAPRIHGNSDIWMPPVVRQESTVNAAESIRLGTGRARSSTSPASGVRSKDEPSLGSVFRRVKWSVT